MLSCHVRNERHPRSRNGHPAQRTIGVARTASRICVHVAVGKRGRPDAIAKRSTQALRSKPGIASPIVKSRSGTASANAIQNRRVMDASSGLSASAAAGASGSNAIPQMGQLPGSF